MVEVARRRVLYYSIVTLGSKSVIINSSRVRTLDHGLQADVIESISVVAVLTREFDSAEFRVFGSNRDRTFWNVTLRRVL